MKHVLWAALLPALVALAVIPGGINRSPYAYDEADYMYAASLGAHANHTDTPTLPLFDFLKIGLSRGRHAGARTDLSEQIRSAGDVVLYRHWHGPLYSYWLMALSRWEGCEECMRGLMLVLHALVFLVIYFGCLWVWPGESGIWAARLGSMFYLFGYPNIQTASWISPHPLFVLCYLSALILVAKMAVSAELRWWYGAAALAALAFCTLEVAAALAAALVVICWVERETVFRGWRVKHWSRFAVRSIAVFTGIVLLTWSGAIVRLSFVKAYLFMAYLAVARRSPWGNVGFWETWRLRFSSAPLDWILVGAGILLYFALRRQQKFPRAAYIFLLYAGMMLVAVFRVNSDSLRYMASFFPALQVFAGLILGTLLARLRAPLRYTTAAVITVLLTGYVFVQYRTHPARVDTKSVATIQYVRDHGLAAKRMLVPQDFVPTLHYYFPRIRLKGYVEEIPTAEEAAGDGFDGVLRIGSDIWYNTSP